MFEIMLKLNNGETYEIPDQKEVNFHTFSDNNHFFYKKSGENNLKKTLIYVIPHENLLYAEWK